VFRHQGASCEVPEWTFGALLFAGFVPFCIASSFKARCSSLSDLLATECVVVTTAFQRFSRLIPTGLRNGSSLARLLRLRTQSESLNGLPGFLML